MFMQHYLMLSRNLLYTGLTRAKQLAIIVGPTKAIGLAVRQAKEGIESRQYQIIWLVAQGKKTEEIEEITGYSRTWMYALVKRYNKLGSED
jgi:hypothetical protein